MDEENKVVDTKTTDEGKTSEPSHKPERTEEEKVAYNLRKQAERAKELGLKPEEILGVKPALKIDETLSDDTPLTVATLREFQKQEAKKTSLQLADDIEDEEERDQVKDILTNRLKSSGDPHADLALAHAAVTAQRTKQIAEDLVRKSTVTRTAAGGSAPGKVESEFTPTDVEAVFMAPPYNLSKEKILEARKIAQASQAKASST